jgi:hypothetical protein
LGRADRDANRLPAFFFDEIQAYISWLVTGGQEKEQGKKSQEG